LEMGLTNFLEIRLAHVVLLAIKQLKSTPWVIGFNETSANGHSVLIVRGPKDENCWKKGLQTARGDCDAELQASGTDLTEISKVIRIPTG